MFFSYNRRHETLASRLEVVNEYPNPDIAVLEIRKGETFFSTYMIPKGTEAFANVKKIESGKYKLKLTEHVIAVVEEPHASLKGAKHVRFLSSLRKSKNIRTIRFAKPRRNNLVKNVLEEERPPSIHAKGGLNYCVIHQDEVVVLSHGSYGWILSLEEYTKIKAAHNDVKSP